MLWYLLGPLRGFTQPPRLQPNNPVRRAFYRHGKTTAQHWLVAMLVSVTVAMMFSYPALLAAEHPTTGIGAYPRHVWTLAREYEGNRSNIDAELRQVWIHGSYMQALQKHVLSTALNIQQALVGTSGLPSFFAHSHENENSSRLSWGYHSPLMYWNSSQKSLDSDEDILNTVNRLAGRPSSSLNIILRPASVFAGKKFKGQELLAADALVLTLINHPDTQLTSVWPARMATLTADSCPDCTFYPRDGRVDRHRMFEYGFTPLTTRENFLLMLAYFCMAAYVIVSLRRIEAFHSRFGLVVTAITQMTWSVLASLTICSLMNINLSTIPKNAYPFVVLVIGLENIFRLIKSVLSFPPTLATEIRIASALGEVGPVSVATAAQNIIMLSILANLISPGVATFCVFACVATIFDVFFLLTFFVAVLSVDIRRFELQDALSRANNAKPTRKASPAHRQSFLDALISGRLPFSTRMAGTAVMATFILSLNYHFFEHKDNTTSISQLLQLAGRASLPADSDDPVTANPINASLTHAEWMHMQDFDTAKEVMNLAKPGADSFTIRIFEPLIVVLPGSDRNSTDTGRAWSSAVQSFATHNFYPVAVGVVFAVAFVVVLMNFLLYADIEDETDLEQDGDEELLVRAVNLPHKLDIIKLYGTEQGHLLTIGLDRTICLSRFDRTQSMYNTISLPCDALLAGNWPVQQAAIDHMGEWCAFRSVDDQITTVHSRGVVSAMPTGRYPDDNPSIIFGLFRTGSTESSEIEFLTLTSGGRLASLSTGKRQWMNMTLIDAPLLGGALLEMQGHGQKLVVLTDQAEIAIYQRIDNEWHQTRIRSLPLRTQHGRLTGAAKFEQHAKPEREFVTVTTIAGVVFLDSQLVHILGIVHVDEDWSGFSSLMLGPTMQCDSCGQLSFRSMAIIGDALAKEQCSVITASASDDADIPICIKPSAESCITFEKTTRVNSTVRNPGIWCTTAAQAIIGLRRHQPNDSITRGRHMPTPSQLRQRRRGLAGVSHGGGEENEDNWEAYKLSLDGKLEHVDIPAQPEWDGQALFVDRAGPAVVLDSQSIAVAFGNSVKVIRATRPGSVGSRKPS